MHSYVATVLYPRTASSKFDMKYYLDHHMPLVDKNWTHYGLLGWDVVELGEGAYSTQAVLRWKDGAAFQKAMASDEAKVVFGDIPNFSSEQPTLISGDKKAHRD